MMPVSVSTYISLRLHDSRQYGEVYHRWTDAYPNMLWKMLPMAVNERASTSSRLLKRPLMKLPIAVNERSSSSSRLLNKFEKKLPIAVSERASRGSSRLLKRPPRSGWLLSSSRTLSSLRKLHN